MMIPGSALFFGAAATGGSSGSTTANVSSTNLYQSGTTTKITTLPVTMSWNGVGSGSYTYAWNYIDNSGGLVIDSSAAATTTVSKNVSAPGNIYSAIISGVITDTVSAAVQTTPNVSVTIER